LIDPIVVGVVVLLIGFIATRVYKAVRKRSVWPPIGRGLRRAVMWLINSRPVTERAAKKREQAGYERRNEVIERARASARQPTLRITRRDDLGEVNLMWLENAGYPVNDVRIDANPMYFTPEGEIGWRGSFGSNMPGGSIGVWFKGVPTDLGRDEGVVFDVSWSDDTGERIHRDVVYSAAELDADQRVSLERARRQGHAEGREEAIAEARDAVQIPRPRPRWQVVVAGFNENNQTPMRINNLEERSVAREVRVDVTNNWFEFTTGGTFPDLSGAKYGQFKGRFSQDGSAYGVRFTISWYDENGVALNGYYDYQP
jgi:hypothetical protein